MKLIKSKVQFFEDSHKYVLNGSELSGITTPINQILFPDKYKGVSQEVMKNAAERGSLVHKQIEIYTNSKMNAETKTSFLNFSEPEVNDYIKLIADNKIRMKCAEYLVSDNDNFASKIDLVDTKCNLYDIKTTYKLDDEYVRWQLSIYAYLFDNQNKKLGVSSKKLYAIHLHDGKASLEEVEKIDYSIIEKFLQCAKSGDTFVNPLNSIGDDEEDLIAKYKVANEALNKAEFELDAINESLKELELVKQAEEMQAFYKQQEQEVKSLREEIESRMRGNNTYSIKKSLYSVSLGKDKFVPVFNEELFAQERPAMYAKYLVQKRKTKGTLRINLK